MPRFYPLPAHEPNLWPAIGDIVTTGNFHGLGGWLVARLMTYPWHTHVGISFRLLLLDADKFDPAFVRASTGDNSRPQV